ncbi:MULTISPECIES: hypothetical protein [Paenibacillus]|uniref:Major virion structural protein n=1 Tax=Paenibacillus pabuli TaxID=1472 RepID=A0A855YH65_9BACL|nr:MULTISPECIES: hypothetical protein [Paenibacillus]PWW43820.1 hypothetical protein DET56_10246 [Paenibacillus pabuli]PXW09849.1 hypothetical protein DEU73_10246 [Paenibacillus taichungensis]SEA79913.1 hypothetical protein SAMN03159332_2600 [Paenibacillus sp. 276b]
MTWFDGDATIQLFPDDLEKRFNASGWNTFIKYRAVTGNPNSTKTKFADVRLFRSIGSDGQMRNFGMVYGYGGVVKKAGELDFVSQNSVLGELKLIEGTTDRFQIIVRPVEADSEMVYKNGVYLDKTEYTIDNFTGVVKPNTAPQPTDKFTVSYAPAVNAPSMPKRLFFFTFDDVRSEKIVEGTTGSVGVGDPESILPDGDGTKRTFQIPTPTTIKTDSVRLFINQIEVPTTDFTVDYTANTVTITSTRKAPDAGAELHASYVRILAGSGTGVINYGDILARNFDPQDGKKMLDAVYSCIYYIYPSLPTALSFTPLDNFDRGWQRDSTMYYWGNFTKDRIVMFLRPDPTAGAENTYYAPLYIGRMTTIGKSPRKNNVIFSGCRTKDEVLWAKDMKLGATYVDYGNNTSNGNSSVQLQQSIGGTYYQKHYLAFITHDKSIDAGESRFNPSVYSGKYHISPMYVVHPNDGFVGKLDEVYAVHPKNISQLDELEVLETSKDEDLGVGDGSKAVFHLSHQPSLKDDGTPFLLKVKVDCVEQVLGTDYTIDVGTKTINFEQGKIPAANAEILATYEYKQIYRYTLADTPVSPLTLATISPFAPIGLGILKETLVKNS